MVFNRAYLTEWFIFHMTSLVLNVTLNTHEKPSTCVLLGFRVRFSCIPILHVALEMEKNNKEIVSSSNEFVL